MTIRSWTLAVVCAATAMLMLDIAVVNTALSRIAADLDTDVGGLQWVVDAYTLALSTVVLSAGSLADRLGRRRVFSAGLALFTAASAWCALAPDITMLNVARAVQGIGAAGMFATALALLAQAFPGPRERAGALAIYGASIGGAFAVGPLIGGLLTSGLDWPWIFLINVPLGIACLAVTRARVGESRDAQARVIDWPGQVTFAAGLLLLVLALLRGNEQGWTSTPILAELGGAAVLLTAFVGAELRAAQPMLPLGLFRQGAFAGAQVGTVAMAASFFALFFYTTLYLQGVLGLSPIEAGLAYLPGTVVMALASIATGRLGGRIAPAMLVSLGLALVAVGMLLLTLTGPDSGLAVAVPAEIVALAGVGLFNPAVTGLGLGAVAPQNSGVAAGALTTFRLAGLSVGVAALGALIPATRVLDGIHPGAYVHGFHHALLSGAGLAAAGALATLRLVPRRVLGRGAIAGADRMDALSVPEPA